MADPRFDLALPESWFRPRAVACAWCGMRLKRRDATPRHARGHLSDHLELLDLQRSRLQFGDCPVGKIVHCHVERPRNESPGHHLHRSSGALLGRLAFVEVGRVEQHLGPPAELRRMDGIQRTSSSASHRVGLCSCVPSNRAWRHASQGRRAPDESWRGRGAAWTRGT